MNYESSNAPPVSGDRLGGGCGGYFVAHRLALNTDYESLASLERNLILWLKRFLLRRRSPADRRQALLLRQYLQQRQRDQLQLFLLRRCLPGFRSAGTSAAASAPMASSPIRPRLWKRIVQKIASASGRPMPSSAPPRPRRPCPRRARLRISLQLARRRMLLWVGTLALRLWVNRLRSRGSRIRSARSSSN